MRRSGGISSNKSAMLLTPIVASISSTSLVVCGTNGTLRPLTIFLNYDFWLFFCCSVAVTESKPHGDENI
jgi:hypothetical protein